MSEWKLGNSKGGSFTLPSHLAGMSDRWAKKFCEGRDWAVSHKVDEPPRVAQGCAFWSGYRYQMMVGRETAHAWQDRDFELYTGEDEIAATLEHIPLSGQQWRYWAGCEIEDITGVCVMVGDGEYLSVWVTDSSKPWDLCTTYEPLPVSL